MKNIFYILSVSLFLLFAATGCDDDDYLDIFHPVPEQEFPQGGAGYTPGTELTEPPIQIILPQENAKLFYVDGATPGAETDLYSETQKVGNILSGNAKTHNANLQFQISTGTASNSPAGFDKTATAMDIVVIVPDDVEFDYMWLVNRSWYNGYPYKFEWFLSRKSTPDNFESQGIVVQVPGPPYNQPANNRSREGYDSYCSQLSLPESYIDDVARVKIRVNFADCYNSIFIVIRELEFWKYGKQAEIPECFTDRSCSALKPGTTQAVINAITAPFYQNMAQAIYNGEYEKERIVSVTSMSDADETAGINKSLPYSNLQYPTGVFIKNNATLIVMAEGIQGDDVMITILGKDKANNAGAVQTAILKNGLNEIPCDMSGTVYISGLDRTTNATVNVANGRMNGYFNIDRYDNNTIDFLGNRVDNAENIDIIGNKVMLTVSGADFVRFFKEPADLLGIYDDIVSFQQQFSGMKTNTSKLHYVETTAANPDLDFGNYRGVFKPAYVQAMLDPDVLINSFDEIAGFTAKANIPEGFTWAAVNHANKVLFAAATAEHMGMPVLFSQTPETYGQAYKRFAIDGQTHDNSSAEGYREINAVPLWQLHLYFSKVKNNANFYSGLISALRDSGLNTKVNFAQTVCEQTGYNLTSFFNFWGYALPLDFETTNLAPAVAANVPSQAVEYISDLTEGLYKNPAAVSVAQSFYSVNTGNEYDFDFSGCVNAAAFEVSIGGVPAYISVRDKFGFTTTAGTVTAEAIAHDGTKTPVSLTLR